MSKSGFTPLFTQRDINKWVDIFTDKADEKMYILLQAAGEMFVKYAREDGKYIDHTGNLRSSIGYVIAKQGKVVHTNFKKQDVGTDGNEGLKKARQLSLELVTTHNDGLVLIGVAGMEYAAAVEAIEGKDVITASNIKTEAWMKQAINTVFDRAA